LLAPSDDGELARFVRDHSPEEAEGYETPGGTGDLIRSSLVANDISPVFRAQLFSQLASKVINLDNPGANLTWRQIYGDIFMDRYLGRNMQCLECHNSEFSVTGHSDPNLDRTWEMPGHFEAAVFGQAIGRAPRDVWAFFRVEGVLSLEFGDGHSPWGMAEDGRFIVPDAIEPDPEEWTGYLVAPHVDRPSIWDLERMIRAGFDTLRSNSPLLTPTCSPTAPKRWPG
jgi:hypothetical protein